MRYLAVASTLVMTLAAVGCAAKPIPAIDVPTVDGLDTAAWGPRGKDGDVHFRAALAGKAASMTVPTWWGKSIRPKEGTVYLLTVRYKDTATKPIVFLTHGGVGNYWSNNEVHRFGGSGDGKWKTAHVPVSWDLIMRKRGDADVTELEIRADKDLPVESITVSRLEGKAFFQARDNYEAETRAWIAAAQAEKRKTASLGPKQAPSLPEAWKKRQMVPFARTYMTEIFPGSAPQKGEAGAPLKLRMARNEYETAAVGVYANGVDLNSVRVGTSGLETEGGRKLPCEISIRAAEYSVVATGGRGKPKGYRLYPQRMWPGYGVRIPGGRSHMFWITVKTLGKAVKPGKYTGMVVVSRSDVARIDPNTMATVPIEIEVVDVMLPTMQESGLELGSCGRPALGELKTLAEYNHTGMDIWFGGTQPKMTVTDGKLHLDWYYLDDWMGYARKLDMRHMFWFMGGDPYGFPDTVNLERDLYRAMVGDVHVGRRTFLKKTNASPKKVLPELRPYYKDFMRQLAEHAKKKDWPRMIVHPFDEPAKWVQSSKWENPYHRVIGTGPWIKDHFEDSCALIREAVKGYDNVVTGGDIHHVDRTGKKDGLVFLDDITVFCTNAIHEDQRLGDIVRKAGIEFWQYSGCNDQSPAHRPRFTFGWYFAAYDSVGSLVWAYNAMRRFDTSDGDQWGYGWYTPFGTVETPFMIGLREGWDDRRWIALAKKTDPDGAKALLKPIFKEAIARRSKKGRDTVDDFYAEMAGYEKMNAWRNAVIDLVLKKR